MKKFLSVILMLVLCLGSVLPVMAASEKNVDGLSSNIQVKEISRDQYLKNYASVNGISYAEADRIDKEETLKSLAQENAKNGTRLMKSAKSSNSVSLKSTAYKQVTRGFTVGSSGNFRSTLAAVIQVKVNKYNSTSYGEYQKFVSVTDKGIEVAGSGTATVKKIAFSTEITGETAYGNEIYMMYSGIVEHAISRSYTSGASGAGFTLNQTVGSTYYYRKLAQVDYTFSSNWNLN